MVSLRLTRDQVRFIVEQAREAYPAEACGLITGDGETARAVMPVPNRADDPNRHFFMDESALLKALRQIDARNERLLGIYHSHPVSDPIPSQEDIQAALQVPNAAHLIVSLKYESPRLKAWQITPGQVEAIDLLLDAAKVDEMRNEALSPVQRYAIVLAALLAFALLVGLSLSLLPPAPVLTPTAIR